ncbi:MAG: hypothetical protein HC888_02665 [Candidatus Competibacteraceae bacterium]|nr:hypothetical protein [Candidatus Competibacteraceae bacterium]
MAEKTIGEFRLSPEAQAKYYEWYEWFYQSMEDNPAIEGAISRMDVHLLKTSLLIRASRYEATGNTVEIQDLEDAIRLLDATYASLPFLIGELNPDTFQQNVHRVQMKLMRRGYDPIAKWALGSQFKLSSAELHAVLDELASRGEIRFMFDGVMYERSTRKTNEMIRWIGDIYDGNGEVDGAGRGTYFAKPRILRKSKGYRKSDWDQQDGTAKVVRKGRPRKDSAGDTGTSKSERAEGKNDVGRIRTVETGERGSTPTQKRQRHRAPYGVIHRPGEDISIQREEKVETDDSQV